MRILFLSERFPFPLHDGGNLRTYYLLKGLAEHHEVQLVAHHRSEVDARAIAGWERICPLTLVERPRTWRTIAESMASGRLLTQPLFVAKNWSSPLLAAADRLLTRKRFDAIHFNHLDTACYALHRRWPQCKVFDTHNCLSAMAAELAAASSSPWTRAVYSREARLLKSVEREVCRQMDAVLTCSDNETRQFAQLAGDCRFVVAPNGVDCSRFEPSPHILEEPGTLVFTGAMDYFPNHDAALYFCREVLPLLVNLNPRPKVYLVGRDPPPTVRALADGSTIVVTGRVEDIRPYLQRAMLVVVPLRHGAGTRLKILEAFALGKTVVSTHKGAEGIPALDGREILLAGDAAGLASQIRRVWESRESRSEIGAAAARFARERYDWPRIQQSVLTAYCHLEDADVVAG